MKPKPFVVGDRPAGIQPAITIFTNEPASGDAVFIEITRAFESPYHAGRFLGKAVHCLANAFASANSGKTTEEAIDLIRSGIADALDDIATRDPHIGRGH